MSSFRGFLMRSWRWAQTEWRRRWKLNEYIVILALLQTAFLLCFLAPSQYSSNKALVTEKQRRIGQYVVLFSTSTKKVYPTKEQADTVSKKDQEHSERSFLKSGNIDLILSNNTHRVISRTEGTRGPRVVGNDSIKLKTVYSTFTGSLVDTGDNISQEDINFYDIKDEDDPVIGRGFAEEYVTHRSDGMGFLFIDEHQNVTSAPSVSSHRPKNEVVTVTIDGLKNSQNTLTKNYSNSNYIANAKFKLHPTSKKAYDDVLFENPKIKNYSEPISIREYKFKHYNVSDPPDYILKNDKRTYFVNIGSKRTCFVRGTNIEKTRQTKRKNCMCLDYYYGEDCGIPEAAWFGRYSKLYPNTQLKRRKVPRRIINGLPVNHEFAMFEARMHELYDVVDVFLIAESNYTTYGEAKELQFLNKFQRGYLANFQEKLIYIKLGFVANESKSDGWIADAYIRFYMGFKGLPLLKGLRKDDLFVLSDADELPTREIITFLKLYDGYPEPVGFGLKWNVFNFYWQVSPDASFLNWFSGDKEKMTIVYSASTVGLVQKVLFNNVFFIRKEKAYEHKTVSGKLKKYLEEGHLVSDWIAGTIGHYAGWHCSWCFSPENIVQKMNSAQANDKPRWGDFPEKKNLTYIKSRIKEGIWFDDTDKFIHVKNLKDRFYAPRYFMEHPDDYRSLLFHPAHPLNKGLEWKPP